MKKKAEIKINVVLDEKNMPEKITWKASDSGIENDKEADSMLLSFWDKNEKTTLGLDLWTKDMFVENMNIHVYETLLKLAETYKNSTQQTNTAALLQDFARQFGNEVNLFKKN